MAGQGIKSAGLTFARVATRSGFHIYTHTEYPSLIRGGHNMMQIQVASRPVTAAIRATHFLVALNQEAIDFHHDTLVSGASLLFDPNAGLKLDSVADSVERYPVPLLSLTKEVGGSEIMRNTVALGASLGILGGSLDHLKDLIAEEFADKKTEIVEINHKAATLGFDYVQSNLKEHIRTTLSPKAEAQPTMVINGNQGCAYGALAAGLQFAAIYPMTPTSNILHILAPLQEKYQFLYKQPEDEIAAINMALGAAHAGARAMVATSGGGFCLMTESYGLGALTETPVVIIEGMRGAPATGIPTWTEQGDLQFVLHSHQGDIPRIVLAAGDAQEAFHLTMQAFNLADKFQTPIILLVDKHICENDQNFVPFDYTGFEINRGKFTRDQVEGFERYALSKDGISLRSTAGSGNHFIANSDEHDEHGYSSEEIAVRNRQMTKRMTKFQTCTTEDMTAPKLYGPGEAKITLVSWGSNKGAILEALQELPEVNFLHITWMNPFPVQAVKAQLDKAHYLINIECNYSAQMGQWIRQQTGVEILDNLLKFDGRPIYPEEIIEKVSQVLLSQT